METVASSTTKAVEEESKTATGAKKLALTRPTLTLPPRNAADAFLKGADAATPSPMTFVSSLFSDQDPFAGDHKSFSQLLAGAINSPTTTNGRGDGSLNSSSLPLSADSNVPSTGGGPGSDGLPPRARFKSMMPPRLPIPRSPYLTIPPGLSPTTLLDSPVLLPAGLAELSPTTGTFFFPPFPQDTAGATVPSNYKEWSYGQDVSPTFIFKPHPQLPNSPLASMGPYGLSHQQALAQVQAQASSQQVSGSAGSGTSGFEPTSTMPSVTVAASTGADSSSQAVSSHEPLAESSEKTLLSSQSIVPVYPLPHLVERPSEDGYNWRKYGQKQVKGSEYPRSYYKCTHPSCPVKKKVERSYEGQITEIVYKGEHNHTKPQSTRRNTMSNTHVTDASTREGSLSSTLDRASALFELNKADSDRSQPAGGLIGTPEPSLASTSDDEAEDGGDNESDPKRIKLEKMREVIPNPPLRTIREPRVVVQTTSEVDILDDGYRWRKYGQKVVKGNPHPRSYYKCTNVGCTVRKHVERSSTDPKSVITTYEGKHNHDVPAARNSNHEVSVATVAPGSNTRPRANVWGTGQGRGATSLQEQLFGKLLEVADMETNNTMQKALMYNQGSSQGGGGPSQVGMGSNIAGAGDYYGQVRPKEEPGEALSVDVISSGYQPRLAS
ncbi:hypothetical protein GOP47_0002097 [Adiantum capillus-veneris]|uniref:WRKY domain-containing protein n=1 Tax=Adiantum capillus-veneris TaxID=13818 RepID=A0A9D4VA84_ADICA|nr:hypothetical protein GOP47_0002097 [Adiantum capillus-veneris]